MRKALSFRILVHIANSEIIAILRYLYNALKDKGGILLLDSDFDDSFQISVFLLDYLTDYEESNKDFDLVPLSKCIT